MAYERGLLTQPDLSLIQERLLVTVLVQQKEDKQQQMEEDFEKLIVIHRPEVWQKIQEEREEAEEMGFEEVVNIVPESLEEMLEIDKLFNNNDLISMSNFQNIDVAQLGEEE